MGTEDGGAAVGFIDLVNPGGRGESDLISVGATITITEYSPEYSVHTGRVDYGVNDSRRKYNLRHR